MTDYARSLLLFAHTAARGSQDVEVFCFGTRLTRVTPYMGAPDTGSLLARTADAVVDWGGGTRIASSLKAFLDSSDIPEWLVVPWWWCSLTGWSATTRPLSVRRWRG